LEGRGISFTTRYCPDPEGVLSVYSNPLRHVRTS
jgi:hypothetical protein